jgi:hypothetical protein
VVAEATEPDVAPQATEAGPCSNLQGRITSVTAVGPGKVAVEGLAQPGAADDPACDTGAHLYAYSGRGNMEFWYKDMVLGQSEVRPTGGAFAGNVTMVMGSWAVCLEDAQRRPLDCVNVLHPGAKNEAGVWRPAPPIVRGWINVHLGQARPDGGGHEHLPECGHCI